MPANTREERIEFTAIDKSLSSVVNQINQNIGVLRSGVDTVKRALEAVGVTVGVGAMAKLYADTLKANAGFADLKLQTGASVENLSKISELARIGGQDFGGFTEQIGRMVKGLKSSNDEGQLASAALRFMGVAAKDANGNFRDTGDIVFDVAKALQRYSNDGNQMALVQDALGKGAQKYLPLLKDMAEAGGENAKITDEQARQAQELEKNLNRLKGQFEDARRELVINLTPALLDFTDKLLAAKSATGGLGPALTSMFLTNTGDISAELKRLRAELDAIEAPRRPAPDAGFEAAPLAKVFSFFSKEKSEAAGRDLGQTLLGMDASVLRNQIAFLEELERRRNAAAAKAGAGDPKSPLFEFPQPSGYQSPDLHKNDTEAKLYTRSLQQLEEELGKLNDLTKAEIVINRVTTGSWKELTDEHKAYLIAIAGEYDDKQRLLVVQKEYVEAWTNEARVLDASRNVHKAQLESYRAERDELQFQATLLDKTPRQLELANAERKIELDLRSRLAQLPRDEEGEILPGAVPAMDALLEQAEQQKKVVRALIADRQAAERDWLVGAKRGFAEYQDAATNAAQNTHDFITNSLGSMESAFVQWARTGKLESRGLAEAIIADFIRISTRQNITGPLAGYLGGLDLSNLGALFTGSGYGSAGGAAGAFDYTDAAGQVVPEFAEGGIMTSRGPLPLRRYAGGGIADSPQLAMFGEGATNEAFVPLPDGRRIPVQMSGQSSQSQAAAGHTFIIDARGADRTGLSQLQALISRLDGSVEYRAVAAVRRAAARRGRAAAF